MTDSEYEEACHRAQDEAWKATELKFYAMKEAVCFGHADSVVERAGAECRRMLASYEAKEWMPSPEKEP